MTERQRGDVNPGTPPRGTAGGVAPAAMPIVGMGMISWGSVWAGVLVALATQIILGAFGLAIGLYSFRAGGSALWQALWLFIALFLGGYVAARLGVTPTSANGAWHGMIVWALAVTLSLLISAVGAAGVIGMIPARAISAAGVPTSFISNTAWGVFAGALIGLGFAIWGGITGGRREQAAQR